MLVLSVSMAVACSVIQAISGETGGGGRFESVFDGEIGNAGLFVACGLDPDTPYLVQAEHRGQSAATSVQTAGGRDRIYVVNLRLQMP